MDKMLAWIYLKIFMAIGFSLITLYLIGPIVFDLQRKKQISFTLIFKFNEENIVFSTKGI